MLNLFNTGRNEFLPEDEGKFWGSYARFYENLEKTGPYRALCEVVGRMITPKNGSVWLDVGCGPASMSKLVWQKCKSVKKIVGIDVVIEPAEKTKKTDLADAPFEPVCGDVGGPIEFPDAYFDGIISNLVYPYVYNFEGYTGKDALTATLKEAYRVLKPGGQLIWSTPKRDVNFWWVFAASAPDMLNFGEYLKGDWTRFVQGIPIIRHALKIQEKGKNGFYTFLNPDQAIPVMKEIGFSKIDVQLTFAHQAWVYKAIKI